MGIYSLLFLNMPKPKKPRKVNFTPTATYFKPQGVPLASLKEVNLTLDELEAVRLVDFEGLEQIAAAKKMKVSQSTLQRILKNARKNIPKRTKMTHPITESVHVII